MSEYIHTVDDRERERIQRFLYGVGIVTVVLAVVVVLLILTARYWVGLVGHGTERRFIEPHVEWVSEHLLQPADPVLQDYVATLGFAIASSMDLPPELELEFRVVEGTAVNAITTLGGYIFVLDGLLREVDSENALAMVLAHEIAHAANRDPLSSASRGVLLQILASSFSGGAGVERSSSADLSAEMMLYAYSRAQEEAADRMAVEALFARYGHVGGAAALFEALESGADRGEVPPLLASHPATRERIAAIEALAADRGWPSRDAQAYPAEVAAAISSRP